MSMSLFYYVFSSLDFQHGILCITFYTLFDKNLNFSFGIIRLLFTIEFLRKMSNQREKKET